MKYIPKILQVLMLALCGAGIGYILKLPIGLLIGSFFIISIAQIYGLNALPLRKDAQQGIQMLIGGFVGLNLNSDLLPYLLNLIISGLMASIAHLLFAFLFAYLLTKYLKFDWITALCGTIPAGMSEVSIVAGEVGADVQTVMLMHLFRVSLLVIIIPIMINFLL
jgi:membrane AbrB-like protein